MAVGLLLQFSGMGKTEYDAVNAQLDIDQTSGSGDWPPGLLSHAAGLGDDGNLIVMEVWESRGAQEAFMTGRLGRALAAGGITVRPSVTWIDPLFSYWTPNSSD